MSIAALAVGLVVLSPSVAENDLKASAGAAPVLTADETARLLRVEPTLVTDLARSGEIPGRQVGGEWRFARTAVLDWLAGGGIVQLPPQNPQTEPPATVIAAVPAADPLPSAPTTARTSDHSAVTLTGEPVSTSPRQAQLRADAPSLVVDAPSGSWTPPPLVVTTTTGATANAAAGQKAIGQTDPIIGEPAAPAGGEPLSEFAMASITARGVDASASPGDGDTDTVVDESGTAADGDGETIETIGERPALPTAEDVSLRRERALLRAGEATIEADFFYTKSEQEVLRSLDNGDLELVRIADTDTYTGALIARYGIIDDLQAIVGGSVFHRERAPLISRTTVSSTSQTASGDVNVALRYAVLKEGPGRPDVILSVDGQMPIQDSSFAVGGSVSLVKSFDPVVLFGEVRYRHTFSRDFSDVTLLEPENTWSFSAGHAFAINDTLSFRTQLTGIFSSETTFTNATLPSRERFFLQFGVTSWLSEGLFIEPTVAFALNGPPSVTVGLSLPFTFTP